MQAGEPIAHYGLGVTLYRLERFQAYRHLRYYTEIAPNVAIGPTAQMLHVWTIPYQGGPFADINTSALITAVTTELQRRATAGRPS